MLLYWHFYCSFIVCCTLFRFNSLIPYRSFALVLPLPFGLSDETLEHNSILFVLFILFSFHFISEYAIKSRMRTNHLVQMRTMDKAQRERERD